MASQSGAGFRESNFNAFLRLYGIFNYFILIFNVRSIALNGALFANFSSNLSQVFFSRKRYHLS